MCSGSFKIKFLVQKWNSMYVNIFQLTQAGYAHLHFGLFQKQIPVGRLLDQKSYSFIPVSLETLFCYIQIWENLNPDVLIRKPALPGGPGGPGGPLNPSRPGNPGMPLSPFSPSFPANPKVKNNGLKIQVRILSELPTS